MNVRADHELFSVPHCISLSRRYSTPETANQGCNFGCIPSVEARSHLPHRMSILLAPMCMSRHVTVPAVTALLGSRSSNASVVMSTAWSGALTQEGTGLAADGALVDFNSQYDGKGGRPAAHLVIAWPHGVPS
eukprot:scaffold10015_cov58-Phaeocystis_antarctica.AAC.2